MTQLRETPHQETTTHGQSGVFATAEAEVSARPGRAAYAHTLRAAWSKFRAAERRFADSIWGDLLGGVCVVIILIGLLFLPLFIEH